MRKQKTDGRAYAQGSEEYRTIQKQPFSIEFGRLPRHIDLGAVIGDDEIIQVRRVGHQPVRQRFFPPQQAAHRVGLADDHAGNIRYPGVFRDLEGHVVPDDRFQLRA